MALLIVTCRDEHGIDEDKTHCIDVDDNRITSMMKGSKISYDSSTLTIGKCKIGIANHWTFGGSWCAEEFLTSNKEIRRLLKYLKKTGHWDIEESTCEFDTNCKSIQKLGNNNED